LVAGLYVLFWLLVEYGPLPLGGPLNCIVSVAPGFGVASWWALGLALVPAILGIPLAHGEDDSGALLATAPVLAALIAVGVLVARAAAAAVPAIAPSRPNAQGQSLHCRSGYLCGYRGSPAGPFCASSPF
jgi:hypothetical protein